MAVPNRRSDDIRSGLAADFRERVLTSVGNAGEPVRRPV
jgi:hypothetical protein